MSLPDNQGRCRRVPPPGDQAEASCFDVWLNKSGDPIRDPETGRVELTTASGRLVADPGEWVVKTIGGAVILARAA